MATRYDHRKLAFQNNPRWKKRRISRSMNLKELDEDFNRERRGTLELGGGLLGHGRNFNANNASNFQKIPSSRQQHQSSKGNRRRGTIYVTESETETRRKDTRRQVHYTEDNDEANDLLNEMEESYNLANILEDDGDDEEALQNIMVHLEEKQKKREQEKYGEDFQVIKDRMADLLGDYSDLEEDDEFDMSKLTDPDFFVSKETKEKNSAQNEINKLLDEYLELCHDRSDILSTVHDALNFEEIMRTIKSPEAEDLDNVSSEISVTIDMINQSSNKLSKLYNRLLKLYSEKSVTEENPVAQAQLRQLDLQKQVISKFKTLQNQNVKRKEKVDTWKYAANEIVDLLKSVRKEGATDFEQLEKEFKKLLQAFTQQSQLIDEHQDTISKQRANIKKIEAMKEKLKNDNMLLQDEYDRSRVHAKTMQMKCNKLETEVKETQEKLIEVKNTQVQGPQRETLTESSDGTKGVCYIQEEETSARVEQLKKSLQKVEKELKLEQQKNKDLISGKYQIQDSTKQALSLSQNQDPESGSTFNISENGYQKDSFSDNNSRQGSIKKKCMKCSSYKTRLEEMTKDLQHKREQIVQLSKRMNGSEGEVDLITDADDVCKEATNKVTLQYEENNNVNNDMLQRKNIKKDDLVDGNNTPIPPNPSNSLETNIEQEVTPSNHQINIIRSSTKQIVVYQQISVEKTQNIDVTDQFTQTDFIERPVILKQRASIPTQNVIAKNYSSLVDEDIKNMASRIYSYVNSLDALPNKKPSNEELPSTGQSSSDPNNNFPASESISEGNHVISARTSHNTDGKVSMSVSERSNIMAVPIQEEPSNEVVNYEQKQNVNASEESPQLPQIKISGQNSTEQSNIADSIKRRGNESGFFDDGTVKVENTESRSSKWQKVRSGVVSHMLRFLNNAAKKRCTFLKNSFQHLDPTNLTDEQIVKCELSVFAEHAIDMLDVISYTIKQMHECTNVPLALPGDGETPMISKLRETWQPYRQHSPHVKFSDMPNGKRQHEGVLPDIAKLTSAKSKQKKTEEEASKEMKAKVAEKKRTKILERHKKLVNKLRQSGVGLKQIYTILGIQNSDQDEEVPNLISPRKTNRKISLVGHGYRNDVLKTQDYHDEKFQRVTGLTIHGAGGVRGYSRRLSLVDLENGKSTVFPAIQPKLAVTPVLFGSNFFQTRPLTGGKKSSGPYRH